jgi:hypothetical protein
MKRFRRSPLPIAPAGKWKGRPRQPDPSDKAQARKRKLHAAEPCEGWENASDLLIVSVNVSIGMSMRIRISRTMRTRGVRLGFYGYANPAAIKFRRFHLTVPRQHQVTQSTASSHSIDSIKSLNRQHLSRCAIHFRVVWLLKYLFQLCLIMEEGMFW